MGVDVSLAYGEPPPGPLPQLSAVKQSCRSAYDETCRLSGRVRVSSAGGHHLSIGGLVVFPSQIEEVLVRHDEFGSDFCIVVEKVNNLDRLTMQVEIRGLDGMSEEASAKHARTLASGVKATVYVTPKTELHTPFALPRITSGQGKTACHRVDDRRGA